MDPARAFKIIPNELCESKWSGFISRISECLKQSKIESQTRATPQQFP